MNTKKIVVSLLLLSAFGAATAEQVYPPETPFVSHKTRAEVIQELKQARANGEVPVNDEYPVQAKFKSTLTRQAVIEELKQAQHSPAVDTGA